MAYTENDIEYLKKEIEKYENGNRLLHSLSVEQCAKELCKTQGIGGQAELKIRIAALLHDITKQERDQRELFDSLGMTFTENDRLSPQTLHARTGAYMAKKLYPTLVDGQIADMIYCHCTGKKIMSIDEKIVFLADYIEPRREHEACKRLRKYYFSHKNEKNPSDILDTAVFLAYDLTVRDLTGKGAFIHPDTLEGLEYAKKCINADERKIMEEINEMTATAEGEVRSLTNAEPKEIAQAIAEILDNKKARDIKILSVNDRTVIADYFVIATANSSTQVKSLADEVEYKLGLAGLTPHHVDGMGNSEWTVLDFACVIVHVFLKSAREFYKLDRLWENALELNEEKENDGDVQ